MLLPLCATFVLAFSFLPRNVNAADMRCLVSRAGFGLVSETCPAQTVGCRIRIQRNAITFYEYLDRNQFVCVLKGEFGEQFGSGCIRKRSGSIRCWCFGRSNCNSPEHSKLLYEAFVSGNEQKLTKATSASTTKMSFTYSSSTFLPPITLTSTKIVRTAAVHRLHKEQKIATFADAGRQFMTTTTTATTTTAPPSLNNTNSNSNRTLQSEYDRQNRVHVIHVSSRDQYEPVFGSAALRRIMAEERERLRAESEDISAEVQDDYDEAEEAEEEAADLLAPPDVSSDQPPADQGAQMARRVAQRSELTKPNKGSRMEQHQKSSSSSTSASSEDGDGGLESAIRDEYFDSSFYAPALSHRPTQNVFKLTLLALLLALCRV
uniref:Secreted protein n=1 Tax=Globodera pallida TaxID=36090 RepID=A0A183CHL3_GLOPA